MSTLLYALIVLVAFASGMAVYYEIHMGYVRRARAKQRRMRDHRQRWCMCKVV